MFTEQGYKTSIIASYWRWSLLVTNDGAMLVQLGGIWVYVYPFNFYPNGFFTL